MFLRKIDIYGFKSFGRDCSVEWSPHISVLVGPNGGGKSNVVDAIRFALGEQKLRELRLERWEDVLFGGAAGVAPARLAEVVLTLDGSPGLEGNSETWTVARRYYRSGEGEYLINGQPRRLKDVTDLFLDSGLGRASYGVISQGRVEAALFLRPHERLDQLEEAAGVSRYKMRRRETLLHLDDVDIQLARLRDLSAETERQMEAVRESADREARYLALETERSALTQRLEMHAFTLQQNDLGVNRGQLQRLRQDQVLLEQEIGRIEVEQRRKREEEENSAQNVRALTEQWHRHEETVNQEQQELARIMGQTEGLERELADARVRQDRLAARRALIRPQPMDHADDPMEALTQQLQTQRIQVGEAEQAGREREAEFLQAESEAQTARDKLAAAEKTMARLQGLLGVAGELEVAQLLEAFSRDEATLSHTVHQMSQEMVQLTTERERLLQFIKNLDGRVDPLRHQMAQRQARLRSLYQLEAEGEGLSPGVRSVLQASRDGTLSGIIGTAGELIEADAEMVVALESALGGAHQDIVVETELEARTAVQWLQAQGKGRATFLPLDTVRPGHLAAADRQWASAPGMVGWALDLVRFPRKIWAAGSHLLGRVLVASTLAQAVEVGRHHHFRFKTVTLDGQLLHAGGALTGGSRRGLDGRSGRRIEIQTLSKRIEQDREQLLAQEELMSNSRSELELLEKRLDGLRELLSERRHEWQRQVDKKRQMEQMADTEQLPEIIEACRREVSRCELILDQVRQEMQQTQERIRHERDRLHQTELNWNRSREQWERDNLLRQRDAQESLRLEQEGEQLRERIESLLATRQETAQRVAALQDSVGVGQRQAMEFRGELDAETANLGHVQQDRLAMENRRGVLLAEDRRLRQKIGQKEQDCLKIEMRWEGFTPHPDTQPFGDEEEHRRASRRSEAILQEEQAMGPIAGGSLQVFRQLDGRRSELLQELDDVLQARAELLAVIDDLDTETHRRVENAAVRVETAFIQICRELFGGGDAGFRWMTEGEGGLDLWVRPPGKRPGTISLLSGGEKALGGIAWLFALISIRPAPFVILDEAEASLDEANAKRFAEYVSRHRKDTQYIVVSHHKPTMEVADVLWGVSTNGRGFSQMVSVRLEPGKIMSGG